MYGNYDKTEALEDVREALYHLALELERDDADARERCIYRGLAIADRLIGLLPKANREALYRPHIVSFQGTLQTLLAILEVNRARD